MHETYANIEVELHETNANVCFFGGVVRLRYGGFLRKNGDALALLLKKRVGGGKVRA